MDGYNIMRITAFLKKLSDLTNEYSLKIGGCGCCDSPWVGELNGEQYCEGVYGGNLTWNKDEKGYALDICEDEKNK